MIYYGSRYADALLSEHFSPSRYVHTTSVMRRWPTSTSIPNSSSVLWDGANRLDLVAQRNLGDASNYWKILDANPSIVDPFTINPGVLIAVPDHA